MPNSTAQDERRALADKIEEVCRDRLEAGRMYRDSARKVLSTVLANLIDENQASILAALRAEPARGEEMEDRIDAMEEALQRIVQWSEAYPLPVFPEPDLKRARALLEAGGMTLDSLSAHAMRHVVEGVGKIARRALPASHEGGGDAGGGADAP